MLSGCGGSRVPTGAAGPVRQTSVRTSLIVRSNGARNAISGWTPADLQSAYNLRSSTKGDGRIVAVVDAYDNPTWPRI